MYRRSSPRSIGLYANRTNPYVAPKLNIRVINLSFGTDGAQNWYSDPLAAAVENAWRHGIVVVVSAGNDGYNLGRLTNPAIDPYVLAVGASDSMGSVTTIDDRIADYSSRGDSVRRPDIVAPGTSIVSLAVPGSAIDNTYPEGRVDDDLFRGSGSSQAAAVVTGAIAVLLSRHPGLPPDAIKAVIKASGHGIAGTGRNGNPLDQNMKRLDISTAGSAIDNWKRGSLRDQHTYLSPPSKGNGTLEAARGSNHVRYLDADGTPHVLTGEFVATGDPWNWLAWRKSVTAGKPWFNPDDWTGHTWKDATWQGHAWKSHGWAPTPWEGSTWEGHAWKGGGWESTS